MLKKIVFGIFCVMIIFSSVVLANTNKQRYLRKEKNDCNNNCVYNGNCIEDCPMKEECTNNGCQMKEECINNSCPMKENCINNGCMFQNEGCCMKNQNCNNQNEGCQKQCRRMCK